MASQQAEQGKFFGGQIDTLPAAGHSPRQQIHVQIVDLQLGDVNAVAGAAAQ
ncbi:hypothetical protein D3C87_2099520 [compost metagenome]